MLPRYTDTYQPRITQPPSCIHEPHRLSDVPRQYDDAVLLHRQLACIRAAIAKAQHALPGDQDISEARSVLDDMMIAANMR